MAVLSNIFYAILFLSMASGIFTIALLFLTHVLGLNPPLWASVGGMLLYCVPVLAPDVVLFSPEPQMWYRGFYVACGVWALGVGALLLRHIVRSLLAWRAVNSYPLCGDQRLEDICARSVRLVGVKRVPRLCFGTLAEPACAAGLLRPAIILDRRIAGALSDRELLAVFCHELTHLKRRHLLLERAFDLVCVLNWMNPLVWLARRDFALGCETDCDRQALAAAEGVLPEAAYARTMLRLLELSALPPAGTGRSIGATSFLTAKRRLRAITAKRSVVKSLLSAALPAVLLSLLLLLSMLLSRQWFYPYPAYDMGTEYGAAYTETA